MSRPWFDHETGMLRLDEYVAEMPSFRRIMADATASDDELAEHAERTVALLRRLDERLDPETRELATDALCELTVLHALMRHRAALQ